MFVPLITKNLNWEILTKTLVTFKRWNRFKDEKFLILYGSTKNPFYGWGGGWVIKNWYIGRNCLKMGAWTVCRFNGVLAKKTVGVIFFFFLVWYPNAYYELGHNFNCDFNLLMPISSFLTSNKKSTILQLIAY